QVRPYCTTRFGRGRFRMAEHVEVLLACGCTLFGKNVRQNTKERNSHAFLDVRLRFHGIVELVEEQCESDAGGDPQEQPQQQVAPDVWAQGQNTRTRGVEDAYVVGPQHS